MKSTLYSFLIILVLYISFNNCSRENFNGGHTLASNSSQVTNTSRIQYLVIVDNVDIKNGPEPFVKNLVSKLPLGSGNRKLAFAWVIDALQTSDQTIRSQIDLCFKVSKTYNIPFMLHVNHEWLYPGREIDGDLLISQHKDMVEWINWDRKPLENWWSDWDLARIGKPLRFPPRLSFNHPTFIAMNKQKAEVIKDAIRSNGGVSNPLFIGIDSGWETGIEVDYAGQLPAFNALIRKGYSAQNPPADIWAAIAEIGKDLVETEIGFYSDLLTPDRIFSHILINHGPIGSFEDQKGRRHPREAARIPGHTPGFSTFIIPERLEIIKNLVGDKTWVITESWQEQAKTARTLDGSGLPPGLNPPKLVVLYTWQVDIANDPIKLNELRSVLEKSGVPIITNVKPKGYVDKFGPGTIEGWAFDPNESYKSVKIHLYFNTGPSPGRPPDAEIIADAYTRFDVNSKFGITGAHQFIYKLPVNQPLNKVWVYALDTEDPANMSEAIAFGQGLSGAGSQSVPSPTPPTVTNVKPKGYVDKFGPDTIEGWAFDPDEPNKSVKIHLYFDKGPSPGRLPEAEIIANAYERSDVNSKFGITGAHQFIYKLPKNKAYKKVWVYVLDTKDPANMSEAIAFEQGLSLSVTNVKPIGYVDKFGPGTIEGWAFDPDESNKSVKIHLYFNTGPSPGRLPEAEIIANAYTRTDVNSKFGITGAHQFIYKLPTNKAYKKVWVYVLDTKDPANMSEAIAFDHAL